MRVPTCNEVAGRCICCGTRIIHSKDYENDCVNVAVWLKGVVAIIFGGHKSEYNGRGFIIHVCDICLRIAEKDGRISCFYNSLTSEKLPIEDQDAPIFDHFEFDLTLNEETENGLSKDK